MHTDALHPVLVVEPVQAGDAVGALVHVGHILALRAALAAAVLIDIGEATAGVLLAQGILGGLLLGVRPAGESGGPGTLAHRLIDDGAQLYAVVHGHHNLIALILIGLLHAVVVGADGVPGAGHSVGGSGGALTVHGHHRVGVLGQEIGVDVDAVILEQDGGLHGALHVAHVSGAVHGLELDGPDAVGHGGGEGGLVPGYGETQILGDGAERDILGAVLGEDGVARGGGLSLSGQGRSGHGEGEGTCQQGGQELFLVHFFSSLHGFSSKVGIKTARSRRAARRPTERTV